MNKEKCEVCCSRVAYLGFLLDKEELRPDSEKISPVLEYPTPGNIKQLRRFLGMVAWYARFIKGESSIKVPLVKLLHKSREWKWEEAQQKAFETLKRALVMAPVLARPDFSKPFVVQCDASNFAIGAVLTQQGEDGEHPIVYINRVLTPAEKNCTTEKEHLAMLWAIKKLRPYLEGYQFTVITDHSALKWLYKLKEPSGRLARWALQLQQWDFEIIHRKGALHQVPDALSRLQEEEEVGIAGFEAVSDPWYNKMLEDVPKFPKKYSNWRIEDGNLYRYRMDPLLDPIQSREEKWRLVVPAEYREREC